MTNPSTFDRIKKIIVEHLGADPAKVTEDSNFEDDLGADSLDRLGLAFEAELEFGVMISDDEAEAIQIVRDAVRCIDDKRQREAA